MDFFDFNNPLYDIFAASGAIVLVLLAVLTLRSVSQRDRAMMFGKANLDADKQRSSYEQRWRNGDMRSA